MSGLIQGMPSLWQRLVMMTNVELEARVNDVVLVVLNEMVARGHVALVIVVNDRTVRHITARTIGSPGLQHTWPFRNILINAGTNIQGESAAKCSWQVGDQADLGYVAMRKPGTRGNLRQPSNRVLQCQNWIWFKGCLDGVPPWTKPAVIDATTTLCLCSVHQQLVCCEMCCEKPQTAMCSSHELQGVFWTWAMGLKGCVLKIGVSPYRRPPKSSNINHG